MHTDKNQLPTTNTQPQIGLLTIRATLELIDFHNGATAIAHSTLRDDQRVIRIRLCTGHLIVSKSLARADVLIVRFLVSLALTEFCTFWTRASDGRAIGKELRKLAAYEPGENAWGSGFASRLALCEQLRGIDSLPIFGRTPQSGPFELFTLEATQQSPSDIGNWRMRGGQTETVKPVPPKKKPAPMLAGRPPMLAEPAVDPFLTSFYARARELLDGETFAALETLCREEKN